MSDSKKIRKMITTTLGIVLIFAILGTVFDMLNEGKDSGIVFSTEQITFYDVDNSEITISYQDVVSLELVEEPDYGTPAGGKVLGNTRIGTWNSDSLGEYITHTDTSITPCIVIKTENKTYIINYESDDTTVILVDELRKYI